MPISNQDLRKAGLKVTLPRIKILELLENSRQHHLSAEDIYKTLLEQGEDVGLATVYRVLTQFEAAGIIEDSGIRNQVELPEPLVLGIFGVRLKDVCQVLNVGDRIEIYRALTVNPTDIRRKRAAENPVGLYCRGNRFKQLK